MSSHPTSTTEDPRRRQASPTRPDLRLVPGQGGRQAEQLRLALEWEVAPGVPAVPPVPPGLRLVTDEQGDMAAGLPDPRLWAAQLARAVAEVAVGERPPAQLTRHVSRTELSKLAHRAAYVARHPAARAQRGVTHKRVVRAVRVCPVAPGIVETSAVIVGTERAQAIAIRLEATAGRWLATAIDMR